MLDPSPNLDPAPNPATKPNPDVAGDLEQDAKGDLRVSMCEREAVCVCVCVCAEGVSE